MMGLATVVSGGAEALYTVKILKKTEKLQKKIDLFDGLCEDLTKILEDKALQKEQALIDLAAANADLMTATTYEEKTEKMKVVVEKQAAYDKIISFINETKITRLEYIKRLAMLEVSMADETETIWCTDLTEDLPPDATVGTLEVNGEDSQIIIMPGGTQTGALGKLQPVGSSTPHGYAFNLMLMPWWQKRKPTYRVGTILSVSLSTDTCSVRLDIAKSALNNSIGINQGQVGDSAVTLSNVPIVYMDGINARAFGVDDRVVVEFPNRDWLTYRVIGFESHPKKPGRPYVIGENKNGCLGLGIGYAITTTTGTGSSETISYGIHWKYIIRTPPDIPDTDLYWSYDYLSNLHSIFRYSEPIQDGKYKDYYELDEGSLPPSFTVGEKEFIYKGTDVYGRYRYTYTPTVTIESLSWPVTKTYTALTKLKKVFIKASIAGDIGTSFLLADDGTLYCAGGNTYGQLGIDKATGYTMTGGYALPNFLTTSHIQVPGTWSDVHVDGTGWYYAWALDADGHLWVTGYGGGGLNFGGSGTIAVFTRYSCTEFPEDTVWHCVGGPLISGVGSLYREDANNYYIYEGGWSGISLYMTISKADWLAASGGISLKDWIWAGEGSYGDGSTYYTFLGGSYMDPGYGTEAAKPAGTIWSVQSSYDPRQEMTGAWAFTAGAPIREDKNGSLRDVVGGQGIIIT